MPKYESHFEFMIRRCNAIIENLPAKMKRDLSLAQNKKVAGVIFQFWSRQGVNVHQRYHVAIWKNLRKSNKGGKSA